MSLPRREQEPWDCQKVRIYYYILRFFEYLPTCVLVTQQFKRSDEVKKPPVPKKDEKPIHGLVSDKNFIVANAVENILAGK